MIKLELNEILYSDEINDFRGGLTENYVFTQIMKNYDMYYHKDNNMKIDFVIKNNDGIILDHILNGYINTYLNT